MTCAIWLKVTCLMCDSRDAYFYFSWTSDMCYLNDAFSAVVGQELPESTSTSDAGLSHKNGSPLIQPPKLGVGGFVSTGASGEYSDRN
jgi:hypothetical protein